MPCEQLRALVLSLLEPDTEVDTAAASELDTPPHRPGQPKPARASTLDQLIASLPKS